MGDSGGVGGAEIFAGSDRRVGDLIKNHHAELGLAWKDDSRVEWFLELASFDSLYRDSINSSVAFQAFQLEAGLVSGF